MDLGSNALEPDRSAHHASKLYYELLCALLSRRPRTGTVSRREARRNAIISRAATPFPPGFFKHAWARPNTRKRVYLRSPGSISDALVTVENKGPVAMKSSSGSGRMHTTSRAMASAPD
jgi:hypothetical protein